MARDIMKSIDVEVDGETKNFRVRKMDAYAGMYLMKIVTEKAMPLLQDAISGLESDDNSLQMKLVTEYLPKLLQSMSMDELKQLMVLCLQSVDMSFPAGYRAVVDSRGNFGVADLQYNTAICMRLMYEVIVYNCSGFFEESGLSSILGQQSGSLQGQ